MVREKPGTWKDRKLKTAVVVFLLGAGVHFASAQTSSPANTTKANETALNNEIARLRKFLDNKGRYKDKFGGYYDPAANTYTDEKGGILDDWEGYIYKDGSYKSKLGDYWDAPTTTFKLANGEVVPSKGTSSADAIHVLRDAVVEVGKFEKGFIQKAMWGQIATEHPLRPPAITPAENARLAAYLDNQGGYRDNEGGYYDPAAGTYTDKHGGTVDNWQGYTYKDGSYKAATGDYWDGPTKTFKLANGEDLKSPGTTNAEAIKTLRETAKENGRYNSNGIRSAMMARIRLEHP